MSTGYVFPLVEGVGDVHLVEDGVRRVEVRASDADVDVHVASVANFEAPWDVVESQADGVENVTRLRFEDEFVIVLETTEENHDGVEAWHEPVDVVVVHEGAVIPFGFLARTDEVEWVDLEPETAPAAAVWIFVEGLVGDVSPDDTDVAAANEENPLESVFEPRVDVMGLQASGDEECPFLKFAVGGKVDELDAEYAVDIFGSGVLSHASTCVDVIDQSKAGVGAFALVAAGAVAVRGEPGTERDVFVGRQGGKGFALFLVEFGDGGDGGAARPVGDPVVGVHATESVCEDGAQGCCALEDGGPPLSDGRASLAQFNECVPCGGCGCTPGGVAQAYVFDAENEEGHEQEGKPRGDGDECKEG